MQPLKDRIRGFNPKLQKKVMPLFMKPLAGPTDSYGSKRKLASVPFHHLYGLVTSLHVFPDRGFGPTFVDTLLKGPSSTYGCFLKWWAFPPNHPIS